MQQAHYLNQLICECAPDNGFAQDAIEHAVIVGNVKLAGDDLAANVKTVMEQYDAICVAYHKVHSENLAALTDSYSPLLAQIAELPKAA